MYCAVKCLTGSSWLQQLTTTFVLDGSVHAKGNLPLFLGVDCKVMGQCLEIVGCRAARVGHCSSCMVSKGLAERALSEVGSHGNSSNSV